MVLDLLGNALDLTGQQVNIHADFRRILTGDFRQFAYFVRHYGKATAQVTGACRFNGCVERQQVGLPGDLLDHLHDRLNTQTRPRQRTRTFHRHVRLAGQPLYRGPGLGGHGVLLADGAHQFIHRRVQLTRVMLELRSDVFLLTLSLGQHHAQVRQPFEYRQDIAVQPPGIEGVGEVVVFERGNLLDHHMVQTGQFLHLAA